MARRPTVIYKHDFFDDIGIIFFVLRFSDAGSARPCFEVARRGHVQSGIRSARAYL